MNRTVSECLGLSNDRNPPQSVAQCSNGVSEIASIDRFYLHTVLAVDNSCESCVINPRACTKHEHVCPLAGASWKLWTSRAGEGDVMGPPAIGSGRARRSDRAPLALQAGSGNPSKPVTALSLKGAEERSSALGRSKVKKSGGNDGVTTF